MSEEDTIPQNKTVFFAINCVRTFQGLMKKFKDCSRTFKTQVFFKTVQTMRNGVTSQGIL